MQKNLSAKYMELPLRVALMTCESESLSKELTIRYDTMDYINVRQKADELPA